MNCACSATGIAQMVQCPGYDPDDRGIGVQLPAAARYLSLFRNIRTSSEPPVQCVPGLKRPGRGPNHLPRSSSGINALSQCSTSRDWMIWCLLKPRDRFYLFLYFWILQLLRPTVALRRASPLLHIRLSRVLYWQGYSLWPDLSCLSTGAPGECRDYLKVKSLSLSFTSFLVRLSATVPLSKGVRSELVTA
jgi:hypothetical protein